ncbi:hypothetical protein [Streptomyces uncialis]|uniref:hypothetical protein n=1 Tax=Streptomyces uncialis TaxID=1048205 RepID=UPI0033F314FF
MSGDMRPDQERLIAIDRLYAEHWSAQRFGLINELCEQVAATCPDLRSLSHFSNGVVDFSLRPAGVAPLPGGRAGDLEIEREGRSGAQLVLSMQQFEKTLDPLLTGALMRMVVETPTGGLYCGRVKAAQHIVGVTLDGAGVPPMDEALNALITDIRVDLLSLSEEHPGGLDKPYHRLSGGERLHFTAGRQMDEPQVARLRGIWHRFLNPVDLQYAALFTNWNLVCVGDAFEDPTIGVRFLNIDPATRRRKYRDTADQLRDTIAQLRNLLQPVSREPMTRLVLDVQEGAIYFHWLPNGHNGDFVCGVTLDQHQVDNAERRMRELLTELPQPIPRPRSRRQ